MALIEIGMVVGAVVEMAVESGWDRARKHRATQQLLRKLGIDFNPHSAGFDEIYVYTLVLFGMGKPRPIVNIFSQPPVRQLLQRAFILNDRELIEKEARELIEWPALEKLLVDYEVSPEPLLREFLDCFNDSVDRVRTTVEARQDQKLDALISGQQQLPQQVAQHLAPLLQNLIKESHIQVAADRLPHPSTGSVPPTTEPEEAIYNAQIDQARDLLQEEQSGAALSLLRKIDSELEEKEVSSYLRFRIATNIAASLLQLGRREEVANYFEAALKLEPENPVAISNVAYVRLMQNDFEQAARLAQQALDIEPNQPAPLATLVEALGRANKLESLDEETRTAAENHLESRRALAIIFMNTGQHKEAEALLRTSLESEDCETQDRVLLAQAILAPFQERQSREPRFAWSFSTQERDSLAEAETLLTNAINIWRTIEDRSRLHNVLMMRVNARALQSKADLAVQDAEQILAEDPVYWPAVYARAMLAMESGDFVRAERLLERHLTSGSEDVDRLPLDLVYLQNDKPEAALRLLLDDEWDVEGLSLALQLERLTLIAETANKLDNKALLRDVEKQLEELSDADLLVLEARSSISLLIGNEADAVRQLQQAREMAQGAVKDRLTLKLATLYFQQQNFTDAAALYAEVVPGEENVPPMRNFLVSLLNSGDWQRAYELASAIRAGGDAIPVISEVEARVAEYIGDLDLALNLYGQLTELESNNWEHFLRVATIRVRQGDIVEAARGLDAVVERFQNEPRALIEIAKVFAAANRPALQILSSAYRARRLDFDNPESHLTYISLFLNHENDSSLELDPDVIATGTAVRLSAEDETVWFTILDQEPIDRGRGEYHFTDPVAQKLIGLSVGEIVDLKEDSLEDRKYVIDEIQSKFVRAFQETFLSFGSWFPDHPGLHRFKITDNDFSPIFKVSSMQLSWLTQMRELYDSGQLTLEGFAQTIGSTVADVWGSSRTEEGLIRVSTGTDYEKQHHLNLLKTATAVTVDLTSLFSLSYLGQLGLLKTEFDSVYVPQAALDVLVRGIERLKQSRRDHAVIQREGERYTFREVPRELAEHNIQVLEEILGFIRDRTEVVPTVAALDLELSLFERLETVLGQSSIAAILVAKETGSLLYADDLLLRGLARRHYEVQGIWTQPVLLSAMRSDQISREDYFDAVASLVSANYFYVSLDAPLLIHVLEKGNWSVSSEVEKVLKPLRDPRTTAASAVDICADIIIHAWVQPLTQFQRTQILDLTLRTLVAERNPMVVNQLLQPLIDTFPVSMESQLQQVLQEIRLWARVHQALGL